MNTHMPFENIVQGKSVFLYCKWMAPWKIRISVGSVDEKVFTGMDDCAIECSPTISETDDGGVILSFISGHGVSEDQRFLKLYSLFADSLGDLIKGDVRVQEEVKTFSGFTDSRRLVYFTYEKAGPRIHFYEKDHRILKLSDGFCYRISYIPDQPHKILISGKTEKHGVYSLMYNMQDGAQFLLFNGSEPAYKVCIFQDRIHYAHRKGERFEDREVVEVDKLTMKKTNIVTDCVEG